MSSAQSPNEDLESIPEEEHLESIPSAEKDLGLELSRQVQHVDTSATAANSTNTAWPLNSVSSLDPQNRSSLHPSYLSLSPSPSPSGSGVHFQFPIQLPVSLRLPLALLLSKALLESLITLFPIFNNWNSPQPLYSISLGKVILITTTTYLGLEILTGFLKLVSVHVLVVDVGLCILWVLRRGG